MHGSVAHRCHMQTLRSLQYISFVPHFYYKLCLSSCNKIIRDEKGFVEHDKVKFCCYLICW